MKPEELRDLLKRVREGSVDIEKAFKTIKELPFEDLGFAKVDHHRALRNGFPEVVFCQGKTTAQVVQIMQRLALKNNNILATRAGRDVYEAVRLEQPDAVYYEMARAIVVRRRQEESKRGPVLIVSAGTADLPVAEEAAVTAEVLGCLVERLYDVGVAGIHRLFEHKEKLLQARVVIVVAGMEGALASVVGGLVSKPLIAVPTSIGYGANFGGLAALLSMLNSCVAGVGVVNIDNGFGAGVMANSILRIYEDN